MPAHMIQVRNTNTVRANDSTQQTTQAHFDAYSNNKKEKHTANSIQTREIPFVLVYISTALLLIAPFVTYGLIMLSNDDSIYIAWWVTIACFTALTMIATLAFRRIFEGLIQQHLRVHWQSSGYGMPWRWKLFNNNFNTRHGAGMHHSYIDVELDSLMPKFTPQDLLLNMSRI
jgi:cation transport ATPase